MSAGVFTVFTGDTASTVAFAASRPSEPVLSTVSTLAPSGGQRLWTDEDGISHVGLPPFLLDSTARF